MRRNENGHLAGATSTSGKLSWYHDPLPTNCVADRVCAGGTGCGFPDYAYRRGPEIGYKNLAVFFQGCSFNCLFCQNWHFRNQTLAAPFQAVEDLVADVDERTSCICYFGGLIAELKKRPDVRLFEVTRRNQDELFYKICSLFKKME